MAGDSEQGSGGEEAGQTGFSPFVCACFTLNYIVGTGFLALPWAFYQGGWFFSGIFMVLICIVANIGSDYLLSAMARAEFITSSSRIQEAKMKEGGLVGLTERSNEQSSLIANSALSTLSKQSEAKSSGAEDDIDGEYGSTPSARSDQESIIMKNDKLLLVGAKRIDVPELCQIFLGDWGFRGYAVCVSCYLYGALWSFTSVFGSALALAIPSSFGSLWNDDSYALFVLIFALIVVPMSFLELSEQKMVQMTLSGSRILMIALMITTPIAAAIFCRGRGSSPSADSTGGFVETGDVPHFDDQVSPAGAPFFNLFGIHRMLPIMVYAAIFHFSIPALSEEVTEKSQLGNVFGLTFLLCGSLYTCIGLVDSFYFGEKVEQSSNLNWGPYHGGTGRLVLLDDGEPEWIGIAWWAHVISFFVVIFPAINVISAFPLHAFSLGNSLMGIYYGDTIHQVEGNRRITSFFRTIACVPPLIGGLFVRDLGTITDYAGLAGLAIAFCFPAMLYISSDKTLHKMGIYSTRTHYERLGSSNGAALAVLVFGALSIIGVFLSLILTG